MTYFIFLLSTGFPTSQGRAADPEKKVISSWRQRLGSCVREPRTAENGCYNQKLEGAGRSFPGDLRGSPALPTPWFLSASGPQNCEGMHFCCFKTPSWGHCYWSNRKLLQILWTQLGLGRFQVLNSHVGLLPAQCLSLEGSFKAIFQTLLEEWEPWKHVFIQTWGLNPLPGHLSFQNKICCHLP